MKTISNEELINKAKSVVKSRRIQCDCTVGDVGCALLAADGNLYLGVCIDTACGMGFCAEHSAIAAMVTHGGERILKIVAVLHDGAVIPPCGRCREFMRQIHRDNMDADVIVGKDIVVKLKDLLPYPW